ncbi:uncharacterized protein TrAFT101_000312 [Trichoderma asperellum]|uniref:uncharacterized protein n=1 Tax=Trichoderma asperellum TaxID=101201 RepID=UPI00332768D2|nr:hypothetical protein TrAFT101_000312 [Trichoderma asperellum]
MSNCGTINVLQQWPGSSIYTPSNNVPAFILSPIRGLSWFISLAIVLFFLQLTSESLHNHLVMFHITVTVIGPSVIQSAGRGGLRDDRRVIREVWRDGLLLIRGLI